MAAALQQTTGTQALLYQLLSGNSLLLLLVLLEAVVVLALAVSITAVHCGTQCDKQLVKMAGQPTAPGRPAATDYTVSRAAEDSESLS